MEAPETKYLQSQLGDKSVINYSYTDFPIKLLFKDAYYLFVYSWAIPWCVMPLWPYKSGEFCELYPSAMNLLCIAVHGVLLVLQSIFLFGFLPAAIFFPLWMTALGSAGFLALNWTLCQLLNGRDIIYRSDDKYTRGRPDYSHEQWVFLNGVAVGRHWMKSNLNRLALTFGRPVYGIHNKTSGMLFDLIECLIQRNFSYATRDIRTCYRELREFLYDENKTKVVFILHSQGGIEGSLVIDWLLQELPQDLLSKLEVYTFGNAANHFNNPNRHIASQRLKKKHPAAAVETIITEPGLTPSDAGVEKARDGAVATASSGTADGENNSAAAPKQYKARKLNLAKDKAIGHIEHYAHSTDFVAVWGVLHFATNKRNSEQIPRFMGRVFRREIMSGGHQLNQHYLDGMFPLKRDPSTGQFTGADEENAFMEETIEFVTEAQGTACTREAMEISFLTTEGLGGDNVPVGLYGASEKKMRKGHMQVKELSRLWRYRNGQSPSKNLSSLGLGDYHGHDGNM